MKLLKTFLLANLAVAQESGSGESSVEIAGVDFGHGTSIKSSEKGPKMDLVEPIYQECEGSRAVCGNSISARCLNLGESCAQSDPLNSPCDFQCVTECPTGQESVIVTGDSKKTFRKCVTESEIRKMFNFICSSPAGGVPQFELQVPKIFRHKYVEDNRNYTLVPEFNENISFETSQCSQTDETDHFVIFRGGLEGQKDCKINHWSEFENDTLFDVYRATVGYDDLVGSIGDSEHSAIYRKGHHYDFECKVRRTEELSSEMFPYVDGRRGFNSVSDQTETKFEMTRCNDMSCQETSTNGVIDISPDSEVDPMVWFKVNLNKNCGNF